MTTPAQLLTEHFDIWTAVVATKSAAGRGSNHNLELYGLKKLRELILELAVRGLLVPQDPRDEPASALLKKIAAEKARLVKAGNISKQEKLPPIKEDETPFDLPKGWRWVRFGEIAQHNAGKTLDGGRNTGELRDYLTTSNLYWGRFDLSGVRQMPIRDDELDKCTAQKGDLLICEGGEAGRAAVWNEDYKICFQNHVHRARFYCEVNPYYAYRYFEKLSATGEINQYRKGVGISSISGKSLASVIFPLAPISEQRRIVAKVDELMAFCERLEQQQDANIAAHQTLVRVLLAALTAASERGAFEAAWTRIADHFDALFTTAESIAELKQTILQLAVMGKLVPQDPADEPAAVLLKQIAAEKAKLVKAGKIKKQEPLPPIREDEQPFQLPVGWEWVRFGLLVNVKVEMVKPEDFQELDQVAPDSIEKGTGRLLFRRTVQESGVIGPNSRFFKGQILYSKIRPYLSKAIIAEFDGLCSADMYPLEPLCNPHYLLKVMLSEIFLKQVRIAENRVKMPKLNIDNLSNIIVPLAPVRTQQNIVSKIDELMALCDGLHARLAASQTTQRQLADAAARHFLR